MTEENISGDNNGNRRNDSNQTTNHTNTRNNNNANSTSNPTNNGIQFLLNSKLDGVLWLLRLVIVVSMFFFLLPLIGKQHSWYQRILIANAAVSALRLHLRTTAAAGGQGPTVNGGGGVQRRFSRAFLAQILTEDSCHYLMFSAIFLFFARQITLSVVPPFLFAFLHSLAFTQKVLDAFHVNIPIIRNGLTQLNGQQVSMLRLIACTEIFIMPAIIFSVFTGRSNLFLPFVYYRFLTFRYTSQRNPYCRIIFSELRMAIQELASHPKCPAIIKALIYKTIAFLCRLGTSFTATTTATSTSNSAN